MSRRRPGVETIGNAHTVRRRAAPDHAPSHPRRDSPGYDSSRRGAPSNVGAELAELPAWTCIQCRTVQYNAPAHHAYLCHFYRHGEDTTK